MNLSRRQFSTALIAAPFLPGCAQLAKTGISVSDVGDGAKGALAVAKAETMFARIENYIDGDEETLKALRPAARFFQRGIDEVQGDFDRPVIELFDAYPEYVGAAGQMATDAENALLAYSLRTKKPIPDDIAAWWSDVQAGWTTIKKAVRLHDATVKAVMFYRFAKPIALFAGVPLP